MQSERTRTEHLIWHFKQAPFQILHMRTLAENTLGAQAIAAGKITGTKERTTLPYRVDPADDADLLYANLILFAQHVADTTGNPAPRAVRARKWNGRDEPQGLPVCTASEAFLLAGEITRWLEAQAHQIAHNENLYDAPDDLCDLIRKMRSRYPRTEPTFKAYRPRPCPTCGERALHFTTGTTPDDLSVRCDECHDTWPWKDYPELCADG